MLLRRDCISPLHYNDVSSLIEIVAEFGENNSLLTATEATKSVDGERSSIPGD